MVAAAAARVVKSPKVSKPVARSASAVATHSAKANISTQHNTARTQTRVKAAKKIGKQKVKVSGIQQEQRVAATRQIALDKSAIKQSEQAEQRAIRSKGAQRASMLNAAKTPFQPTKPLSSPSLVSPILLIIFTWAAIVIIYAMITSPNSSEGFFSRSREWVGLLYQTKPMFTTSEITSG